MVLWFWFDFIGKRLMTVICSLRCLARKALRRRSMSSLRGGAGGRKVVQEVEGVAGGGAKDGAEGGARLLLWHLITILDPEEMFLSVSGVLARDCAPVSLS